jgi:branched-chain amino acid transport system ATP-binding protein
MSNSDILIDIRQLEVAYGGIRAVRGIDLNVGRGELVSLIGANGAGKSTTLRAICGLVPIAGGDIVYDGASIKGAQSFQLVRKGLVMVPEGRGIFGQLTIAENLAMGGYSRKNQSEIRRDTEHVFELFPRLAERRDQSAGTLSGGEQQMLAMGRAMSLPWGWRP